MGGPSGGMGGPFGDAGKPFEGMGTLSVIRGGFLGGWEPTAIPGAVGLCVHDFGTR